MTALEIDGPNQGRQAAAVTHYARASPLPSSSLRRRRASNRRICLYRHPSLSPTSASSYVTTMMNPIHFQFLLVSGSVFFPKPFFIFSPTTLILRNHTTQSEGPHPSQSQARNWEFDITDAGFTDSTAKFCSWVWLELSKNFETLSLCSRFFFYYVHLHSLIFCYLPP